MASRQQDRVACEIDDGIAHVRLSRPKKRNALDLAMFSAIADTIRRLNALADLRAVIVSGEGECFCAGIDLACLADLATDDGLANLAGRSHDDANIFQYCALGWHDLPVPVIAAVHGAVFGGGLQIALGADTRIGAPDTRMSIMETRWGVVPDMGATLFIDRLIRQDIARELIYSARIVEAREARDIGLLTRIAEDPVGDATALARSIANKSLAAMQASKRLMNGLLDRTREKRLLAETDEQIALLSSPVVQNLLSSRLSRSS